MVKKQQVILIVLVFLALLTPILIQSVYATEIEYHIDKEWVKINVREDGCIDLLYNLTLTCDGGEIKWVRVGQPNEHFTIISCTDLNGEPLETEAIRSGDIGVKIHLKEPISEGESTTIILLTTVDKMVWEDKTNPGNVGVMFIPTWWDTEILDLRVAIILPSGVRKEEIKCTPTWDNCFEENGRLVVYWERFNVPPGEKLTFGVSFPKEYVSKYYIKEEKPFIAPLLEPLFRKTCIFVKFLPIIGLFTIVFFVIVGGVIVVSAKRRYIPPKFEMETLGVRRGLTAVEAATLLELEPRKILTMILYGMLKKGAIQILEVEPKLKVKLTPRGKEMKLRYYEMLFAEAIREDGTLDDVKLAKVINKLRKTVDTKVKYYCRKDTIEYYRGIVRRAWDEVEKAGTPRVKAELYNEKLLWLMMDEEFEEKTRRVMIEEEPIPPTYYWWWYYWMTRQTTEAKPVKPSEVGVPLYKMADSAVKSIERLANKIVSDIEKFTNNLLPSPKPTSSRESPIWRSGCVCACASCACVCACVSCACACASGGVG